jgi:tRNA-dihydrouridine synthase B
LQSAGGWRHESSSTAKAGPQVQIGEHQLQNNLVLAPMAGVTDRPFRQLCRQHGAGLAVSEMVTSDASLYASRKTLRRLDHVGEDKPISVQIVGNQPAKMAHAAQVNVDHGAQIIDINMGCPKKKVCKVAAGSALLRDEVLVGRILEAVVEGVDVPVTLKIRTGWSPDHRNGVRIAQIAEQAGIQALAIHGRTRSCGFGGEAEYDTISRIKKAVSIPVLANGDIDSPQKAEKVLRRTGADALMIGRAAQGRPWVFREIAHYLATGELLPEPGPQWVSKLLLQHLDNLYSFYGSRHGVQVARKHIAWYSKKQPGSHTFRQKVNVAQTTKEQCRLVREYFDNLSTQGEQAA